MPTGVDLVSLNGPDNVGKTTQLRTLSERCSNGQLLGSVHEHDPEPWRRVAASGFDRWWFECSTTAELTQMLLASHTKRVAAREAGQIGLLDRGMPMLLAAAAATSMVKDSVTVQQAVRTVVRLGTKAPPETAILLLPAADDERSYAITSAREGREWTGVYPLYQHRLFEVLNYQVDLGFYNAVIDCENRSVESIHAEVVKSLPPHAHMPHAGKKTVDDLP